ncbi:MAG TPA: hypothetical protein VHD62_11560 [Opitutaceae bacterium]|nr:hypothetical protein [Opitutaceae bacterium]
MTKTPPVVLLVFNRPELTRRALAAIRRAQPERFFVVADGPRRDRPGDAAACAAVRELLQREIDWPCEVRRDYAEENLGCARRVSSGLDWVFAQVEEAVVLEDDCVADESFFPFCAELLARYREEPKVWHIGGANFQAVAQPGRYYFSRYNHVWGWAAWRRSWANFDWEMKDWPELRESSWLRDELGDHWAARYWREAFDAVAAGRVDSWAYRWTYAMWRRGGLAALPGANLVTNIGFASGGTHVRAADRRLSRAATALQFPLPPSEAIARDIAADDFTERTVFSGGWRGALRGKASRLVRRIVGGNESR